MARLTVFFLLLVTVATSSCKRTPEKAVPAETIWKQVGTWSGRGNAQLETFPIERFTWRVRWETKNEQPANAGTLHVTANSGDSGRVLAELVDVRGVGRDVAYITEDPRRYFLVVTSEAVDWTVTAEEPDLR